MASIDDLDFSSGAIPDPETQPRGTMADFAKVAGAGALGVGGDLAANARYAFDLGQSPNASRIAKGIQNLFGAGEDAISDTINPETRKLAAAALTSPEFLSHPVMGLALKATGMAPGLVASVLPGGLLADTVAATIAASTAGGALNSGSGLKEFYKQLDDMPDGDLQEQSPKYKALREVMDEEPARARFTKEVQGLAPAVNFILGAAVNGIGPAGTAARSFAGGVGNVAGAGERGALGAGAVGLTEGALGGAAQSGVADYTGQQSAVEAGFQKDLDLAKTANAALEGGVLGGAMGGVVGAVLHGKTPAATTTEKINRVLDVADADPATPTKNETVPQPKTGATGTPAKPVESAQVGNPQNAPVRGARDGSKKPKTKNEAPVVDAQGPDTDQAAALAASSDSAPATATELAAVTQPGNPQAPPEVAQASRNLDTNQNVPEQPATLAEQQAQLGTPSRKAVMYPNGTDVPAIPDGMKQTKTKRGVFHFDPKQTSAGEIQKLSRVGQENELLGLGPVSKPEVVDRVSTGETPVAVTERTPGGTEVKAAAGTDTTAPAQAAHLEGSKTPGNVVSVEDPNNVIQIRNGKRILRDLRAPDLVAMEPPVAPKPKADTEIKGKKYSQKERAEVDRKIAVAKEVVEAHQPNDVAEDQYHRLPVRRDVVVNRLRSMVKAAEEKLGHQIQSQIKRGKNGDAPSDDANVLTLRIAKDVLRTADKHPQGEAITDAVTTFKTDEALIRAGAKDEVIKRRLEEGDRAKRQVGKNKGNDIEAHAAPEEKLTSLDEEKQSLADAVEKSDDEAVAKPSSEEGVDEHVGETAADVRGKDDVEEGAPAYNPDELHDAADVTDSGKIEQGPSVAHIKLNLEKAKSNLSPREARKAALADMRKPTKNNEAPRAKYETPAKRAQSEALMVDRNPSEAQIKAGNYKKGHRRVDGLDLTLENIRGGKRRGVGENGKPWEVTMPADYGYLRRTEGADGDHVDAYDGRSGDKHFIVDQLDHRTGQFDEHKVMLRFKDEQAARDAYERAFSDGNGKARLGHIHEVSADELKQWLKEGDTTKPHVEHLIHNFDDVNFDVPESARRGEVTAGNGVTVRPVESLSAAEALDKIDLSKETSGVASVLGRFFQSRLKKLAGGVDVHVITPADMARLSPSAKGAYGLHVRNRETGRSEVYISTNAKENGIEHGSRGHVILHELAHAVTVREIEQVPGAERMIRKLAQAANEYIGHPNNHFDLLAEFGEGKLEYGFTNAKEFIAEAFSNKAFQEVLSRIPLDRATAEHLGLGQKSMSIWDVFRGFVKKAIEKVTGKLQNFDSVLDGVMKVGEHITKMHEIENFRATSEKLPQSEAFRLTEQAKDAVEKIVKSPHLQTSERAPFVLKLRTFDNIAQIADHYFGEHNPIRKIQDAVEAMRAYGESLFGKTEPLVRRAVELRAKFGEQFNEYQSLQHDATLANVHPDVPLSDVKNAHLGGKKVVGKAVWAKAQHPELARRFNALPEELKSLWHEQGKYYADTQNAMSMKIMNNLVKAFTGNEDTALARRIHEGNATDADKALLGDHFSTIENAGELSKIEGYYVPLIRRGDHVVTGTYKVTQPGNAKKISSNEFEFKTEKEATDYAKASDLQPTIKKVWVDEKTGEVHQEDPTTGLPHKMTATDLDSKPVYRVEVQNRHVEFTEGRAAAIKRRDELLKAGNIETSEVAPRRYEAGGRQGIELSASLASLVKKLERSEAYKQGTPTQKAMMKQAIEEAAAASRGSTRIQSKSLPRRGVMGYSEDSVKGLVDYAQSSSRYLAKLEHMPEIEAGMKQMEEQLDQDQSKVNHYGRYAIRNEVTKRIEGDNGFQQGGKFAGVVKRAMAISFMDKLGSPAYSVINAMQPGMVTMPYLSGRHGLARSVVALARAYSDISALKIAGQGLRETARRLKGSTAPDDFIGDAKARLNSGAERSLVDELVRVGLVDPSAGMEIHSITRDTSGVGGKIDTGISYLEGVTREMPRAIEAINRLVTGLAAYRLESSRGASHEMAVRYAKDAINNTQFNYSPTNSPSLFNHPMAKIALQFKKYGQGMYQLIGMQIGKAYRNASPGERAQAMKTLIGLAGTHMAIAGALGLPTEPFKYLVMGASAMGLTGATWGDVEDKVRAAAAQAFGKTAGEVFSRGLPRLANLDLSRVGLDSVTSFGEPRSHKDADVKSWLFDSLAGPVVALGGDWIKGINQIGNGELEKAAENLIPFKAASDSLRAYRQATEGKKSASGRETMSAYSVQETAQRMLGFGSGREAEIGASNSAFYRKSQAAKEERSSLVNQWAAASGQDKTKAFAAITKWNAQQPESSKIKMKELTSKLKRDSKANATATHGLVANKRDKRFLAEGEIYNTR